MASQEEIDCWWQELTAIEAAVGKGGLFFDPYKSELRPADIGNLGYNRLSLEAWNARDIDVKFHDLQTWDEKFIGYTGPIGGYDHKDKTFKWDKPKECLLFCRKVHHQIRHKTNLNWPHQFLLG